MVAAAVFAVLWPLSRRAPDAAPDSDLAVYRDQLAEIERDRTSGAIEPAEADAARVEVSRRLLAAADAQAAGMPADADAQTFRRRAAAVMALAAIPLTAGVLYLTLGSPNLPGQPLSARISAPQDQTLASLIARVEAHLAQSPGDGKGWEVIAPVYLRLNRFDDAVRAYRNALNILGESPGRHADLAEALVMQASGVVTAEANSQFQRAAQLGDGDPRVQFYLGLAAEQDGRNEVAAKIWRALIERGPADAPWIGTVREALARVDNIPPSPLARGPNAADIAAANEMSPADRDRMVRGMVETLAARLSQDGSDVDGWLRLMQAYVVLGERDKARNAANDARRALKDTPDKLQRIDDRARAIGLDG